MEVDELKRKLMGLWEKTTHNSKDLLGYLFEYYFDIDFIEYEESDGKIISAVCGIPYYFFYGKNKLKGLYLVPLSSEEGFRKKGVLADLIEKMNQRHGQDFDLSFLIPHTELLADYFGSQGYFSSFYILEERYTPLHDFKNDYQLSLLDCDERIRELKSGLIDELRVVEKSECSKDLIEKAIKFIENVERKGNSSINLCHTDKDLEYILSDSSIRHLNAFIALDSDDNITGVAFVQKEEMKRIKVVAYYVANDAAYFSLLDYIKHKMPDYSISVGTTDAKFHMQSLVQHNYASSNPLGGDLDNTFGSIEMPFNINKLLQPLGMVRLLKFDRIMQFLSESRSDIDFKLHIRDYNNSDKDFGEKDKTVYIIKNGKLIIEQIEDLSRDRSILNLSQKEVSELLLRKNDSSNLIMEAFGIPRLNLQMRLLPC